MYTKYIKDFYSGRILGVVIATATNRVGFALANSKGDITKAVKKELIMVAAARSTMKSIEENILEMKSYMSCNRNNSKSNTIFYNKVDQVLDVYTDVCYKATHSKSLPTMVMNRTE